MTTRKPKLQVISNNGTQSIVSMMADLLEESKNGEYQAALCVCLRPDGTFFVTHSGYSTALEMIGALAVAQADMIQQTKE
jgi:hypothetical protein